MFAAPVSSRLGWVAASAFAAIALLACQAIVVPPTATPGQTPGGSAPTNSFPFDPTPPPFQPHGSTQQATVKYVTDGDTIHVEIGGEEFRVRYIGIDAPEIAHDNNPGEPLGPEAAQANKDLVEGQTVILERDVSNTDQFGRLLRYVWLYSPSSLPRWTMVNLELADEGMADVKRYEPDTYWQDYLRQAESNAREAGLGIWSN